MAVLKLKPFCSLICFIGKSDVVTAVSHLEDVTVILTLSFSSHSVKVGAKRILFGLNVFVVLFAPNYRSAHFLVVDPNLKAVK